MENNKSWLNLKIQSRKDVIAFASDISSIALWPTMRMADIAKTLRDYFYRYIELDGRSEEARELFRSFLRGQTLLKELYLILSPDHQEMILNPTRYCRCGCGYTSPHHEDFLPGHHVMMKNSYSIETQKQGIVRREVKRYHPLLSENGALYRLG
jgi:hypothetical protein